MSFEVTHVLGPVALVGADSPENAAKAIQYVYNEVATRGGEIVAAHTLKIHPNEGVNNPTLDVLFLVADIPEQSGRAATEVTDTFGV